MTLKRIFIAFLFIITASHVFSFISIWNISDWEKKIKSLDCVESLEIEKASPEDKEDTLYHIKIYLTGNRFLQIRYFNPYIEDQYPGEFYVERIGDIVPVLWGYSCNRVSINDNDGYGYHLGFDRFRFDYLCYSMKKKNGILDLVKNYDEFLNIISNLPDYLREFSEENVLNVMLGKKPEFASWNKYDSPYIYSKYDKKRKFWKEYKFYKFTVEEFNSFVALHDWKWIRWEWDILEENP